MICISLSVSTDNNLEVEMSRYLHNMMLSHTYEICGDRLVGSPLHEFSHTENAVLSYSPALKTIISKLLTNILVLCKVFCSTAWYKEQLQRWLSWFILLLHMGTRSLFLQTFLETVFRGKILPTSNALC